MAGGEIQVVNGNDDEGAGAVHVGAQAVEHLHLVTHVQRAGGFVEQQQFWFAQQALGQQDQLLLAAGERVHAAVVQVADAEFVQHGNGLIDQRVANPPAQPFVAAQQHGFGDADAGAHVGLLGHVADFAQLYRPALPVDGAAKGIDGGNGIDQRGFAGAVGADQADDLAPFQRAGNVLQDLGLAAGDGDGFQLETHAGTSTLRRPGTGPGRPENMEMQSLPILRSPAGQGWQVAGNRPEKAEMQPLLILRSPVGQ